MTAIIVIKTGNTNFLRGCILFIWIIEPAHFLFAKKGEREKNAADDSSRK